MSKKEWGAIILRPSCLNHCVFCGLVRTTPEELRREELAVAQNLAEFKRRRINKVEISGNDPIEYEKLVSLVKYMRRQGIIGIQLSTHGRQLADEDFLNALIAAGITKFRIPLYGSRAEIHDAVTQAPDSFKETWRGIRLLLKKAVELQVSYLVMEQNKHDVTDIIDLMKRVGVNDFYMAYPFLSNVNDDAHYIPLKDMGPYIGRAYKHAKKVNYPVQFMEIPFCVFGFRADNITNNTLPPDQGEHCQPQELHRTEVKDMPQYRIKKKVAICRRCACRNYCDGFPRNDVDKYGTGKLRPIKP